MKRFIHTQNGFSLAELMVTIVVFSLLLSAVYQTLVSSVTSVSKGTAGAEMQQNLRVAMDEIVKDTRQAGYGLGSHPAFTKAGKQEIQFWANVDDVAPTNLIRYYIGSVTDLSDTPNPNDAILYKEDAEFSAQPMPIAAGARQMEFQYYDKNGVALLNGSADSSQVEADTTVADMNGNGASDLGDIRAIEVRLVFETDKPNHKMSFNNGYLQYSLMTTVRPMNLRLLQAQGTPDQLLSVEITPDPAPTLRINDRFQLTALATYKVSGTRDVTNLAEWVSSDTTVATVGTNTGGAHEGSSAGLVSALDVGNTEISCTFDGMASSNSVTIKIGGPDVLSVRINGFPKYAMITGTAATVTLTAQINDLAYGGSVILIAGHAVQLMGVSGPMDPADGVFDTPVENVVTIVDISGWTSAQSPYRFLVQGQTVDSPGSWGPTGSAQLIIMDSDQVGPVVKNVNAIPSATITMGTASITITANIDDQPMGGSNITAGELSVGLLAPPGSGVPVSAVDGTFDSPLEAVTHTLDTSTWTVFQSPYRIYVVGLDASGNWGSANFVDVVVEPTDNQGPVVTALTGPASITSGTATVSVSGAATDVGTGGSNIWAVELFGDTDPGPGNGEPATPTDGAFDSPTEAFSGTVSSFTWTPSTAHTVNARAQDLGGVWGAAKTISVGVTSTVNGSDAVVALTNGSFEVWYGDGFGGYKKKDSYLTPGNVKDLVITDLNADKNADVVLAKAEGDVEIWMNDGFSLGVSPSQTIVVGSAVTGVLAADFNGDLLEDVIATTNNGQVLYYQNDGTGVLNTSSYVTYTPTLLANIQGVVAADLNGDSFLDLVIAGVDNDLITNEVQVLLHPGLAGGPWTVQGSNFVGELAGLNAEDYNTDGMMDVLLALNDVTNGLQVWTGDGLGALSPTALQVWNDVILSIESSDTDGDGDVDVMLGTLGSSGQEVYISSNNGSGYFDTVSPFYAGVGSPVTAVAFDFLDADNIVDFVAGAQSPSLVTYIQQPTKDFLQSLNSPFSSSAPAVVLRTGEIGN